jgi:hypothetical protein
VDFCFRRVSRPALAAGALALLTSFVSAPIANAQGAPAGQQPAAAGQQPAAGGQQPAAGAATKNYKDSAEYDLYLKITQTADPKARLQLLNTWQDKYPTSDYAPDRLQYFVDTLSRLAASDPTQRQALIDKCKEQLKADPTNFRANYGIAFWGPQLGGAAPPPDLLSAVESSAKATVEGADATFADAKKPPTVQPADWAKFKSGALAVGHNALAWAAQSKKDMATAEAEYRASLTANPDQGNISAVLAKLLVDSKDDKKYPDALFEYARAGQYSGPGPAVPADSRAKLLTYFNDAYTKYHGSADGASQILEQAKTNALPPSGFTVGSAQAKAVADAASLQQRVDSDPAFKIWYAIESNIKEKGDAYFTSSVKDAEIPGGTDTSKYFTGTVLSADRSKVTLGVEDEKVPDATILFTTPLKDTEAAKIKVGDKLQFSGIAESFVKDPYMLTFKDPSIPNVVTTAPVKTGKKGRR